MGSGTEKGRSAPAAAVQPGWRRHLSGPSGSAEQHLELCRAHPCQVCSSVQLRCHHTIDFNDALEHHQTSGADITFIYGKGIYNRDSCPNSCILQIDENDTIQEVLTNPLLSGECNISLDMFIMNTDFLKQVVLEAISKNQQSLIRDVLQARKDEFVFKAYEHKGCFYRVNSLEAYYKANLALLDTKIRNNIFSAEAPIYTKVGDNPPVKYGLEANVKNSLIADRLRH